MHGRNMQIVTALEHDGRKTHGERLARPFQRFASLASSSGLALIFASLAALVWTNFISADSHEKFFHGTSIDLMIVDYERDAQPTQAHDAVSAGDRARGPGEAPAAEAEPGPEPEPESGPGPGPGPGFPGPESSPSRTGWLLDFSIGHWINDLLMAVFFLLVALEIKREILVGELASVRKAALPIAAAVGGMLAPAGIYMLINRGSPDSLHGWGVPIATDIAFALGILALLGKRIPNSLKVFLASLAIADDLGALVVIAVFYTERLDWAMLGMVGVTMAALASLNMLKVRWITLYLLLGAPLWYFTYASGVHATIAGVLLAATIPATARVAPGHFARSTRSALDVFEHAGEDHDDIRRNSTRLTAIQAIRANANFVTPPLHRLEHSLHPWVAFLIVPLFALANAGMVITSNPAEIAGDPVSRGVILGLAVGKPLGVVLACALMVKLGVCRLPKGVRWKHIIGCGFLAGIGFTMALFIANLAFKGETPAMGEHLERAKLGILIASAISAVVGGAILLSCKILPEPEPDEIGPLLREFDDPGDVDGDVGGAAAALSPAGSAPAGDTMAS